MGVMGTEAITHLRTLVPRLLGLMNDKHDSEILMLAVATTVHKVGEME